MIRLFISHSSRDEQLAGLLVELFRAGTELSPSEIRCTSVDGYRLPIGADTDDQLREELLEAPSFLGLISQAALGSSYVLFELGARWGASLHLAPLLAPGVDPRLLPGPISGKNALKADRAEDLQQTLHDIAKVLDVEVRNPALVQSYIGAIIRLSEQGTAVPTAPPPAAAAVHSDTTASFPTDLSQSQEGIEARETAEQIIQRTCTVRWPQDFRMKAHCLEQQRSALAELSTHGPTDVPGDVFLQIRQMCRSRWPEDFRMRLHCEQQQVEAWRNLR